MYYTFLHTNMSSRGNVRLLTRTATPRYLAQVLSQVRNTIPVWYGLLIYREHIPANSLASYIAGSVALVPAVVCARHGVLPRGRVRLYSPL